MTGAGGDIVVVGGGIVGLALSCLLRGEGGEAAPRVLVVEQRPPSPPGQDLDLRVSAISPASQQVLQDCGAWQALPRARLGSYSRMHVWRGADPHGAQHILFDAAEQGVPVLGHIVENALLRYALWERARALDVGLREGTGLETLSLGPERVSLSLANGERLDAQLVIGADGAASRVRELAGMRARQRAYGQQGLVTHVQSELPHEETAWQRFLPDGPVALLPLADGRSSVVWSCPDARAGELLSVSPEAFGAALSNATQGVIGELRVAAERRAFPLSAAHAKRYCVERVVLVGDAAHRVHPLAGQGVNLGLADAAELARLLRQQAAHPYADYGDLRVLRRYERARKGDNLLTLGSLDLFNRVFSDGGPLLAAAGGLGLGAADRLGPLKRRLAAQALGRSH